MNSMSLTSIAQTLYDEAVKTGMIVLDDTLLNSGAAFATLVQDDLLRSEGNILLQANPADIPQHPGGNSFSFPVVLPVNVTDSFLHLIDNTATVVFTQVDDACQVQLTVNLTQTADGSSNWVFSDSFPRLLGWPFDFMSFLNPQFIFIYGSFNLSPGTFQGLNFYAGFTLTNVLGPVAQLLTMFGNGSPQTSVFQGLITQTKNGPLFNLNGVIEDIPPLNLQALTVSQPVVTMGMSYETGPDNQVAPWGEIMLAVNTTFGDENDALEATFILDYDTSNTNITLLIAPAPGSLVTSINQMGEWMAGKNWNEFFAKYPANILQPYLQTFGIQSYAIDVSLGNFSVMSTSLAVGTLSAWDIIPNKLVMDNFSVMWLLIDPFGEFSNSNIALAGNLTLYGEDGKKILFKGDIELPGLKLAMGLYTDEEMTAADWLQTIISAFGGGTISPAITHALSIFSMQSMFFNMDVPNETMEFYLNGAITVGSAAVNFKVTLMIDISDGVKYDITVTFILSDREITGEITNDNDKKEVIILCTWRDEVNTVGVADLANALGFENLQIPAALALELKAVTLSYNISSGIFAIAADAAAYGKADLLIFKPVDSDQFVFFGGLNIDRTIDLSNIPLIGKPLSAIERVQVEQMQVMITSAIITPKQVDELNGIINGLSQHLGGALPTIPSQGMASTVDLEMRINVGGYIIPVSTGVGGQSDSGQPPAQTTTTGKPTGNATVPVTTTPAKQSDGTTWLNIQKAVGPLMFRRIGIKFADPVLWFLLDASFEAGGLTIDLNGAGIGSPLDSFSPDFTINGIGIDYKTAGFELGGSLMKVPPTGDVEWQFAGGAVARIANFSLSTMGSYANVYTDSTHTTTTPSMFLFAQVTGTLGGVPAFFVTGVAAGFGYNSALRIPGLGELNSFPLVAGAQNPAKIGGNNASPDEALSILMGTNGGTPWLKDNIGQYWLAAGLQFTSFELVFTNALLIAQFGNHFQFALLGLSRARFPITGPVTYGYVELQIEVVVDPTEGVIALSAVLSANSYVLDPSCKLTGGFAFYAWFSPSDHAGDFVITVGGYHPAFDPPNYYPAIARVGFSWAMDATISITGAAYFALTPAAIMAGGELSVTFHDGDLKAWFKAWANLLIYWNPFHFDVAIGITVGASYRMNLLFTSVTVEASLGAMLHLYGPETGGTVRVSWTVISFTISFGANSSGNPGPISWNEFLQQLPAGNSVLKILPVTGLAANGNTDLNSGAAWVVRPSAFSFSISSALPNSSLTLNSNGTILQQGDTINIRAMQDNRKNGNPGQGKNLPSILNLIVRKEGVELDILDEASAWQITANVENVPQAMWGVGPQDQMPEKNQQLLYNQLTGYQLTAPATIFGASPGLIDAVKNLTDVILIAGVMPVNTQEQAVGTPAEKEDSTISVISRDIASTDTTAIRNALFDTLQQLGVDAGTNDNMLPYATAVPSIFAAIPLIIKTTSYA
jgi:hypothetical protein